jgi:hypothetical protein
MGDGGCSSFFVAPFYTVPLGVKRSVKSQAPNGESCIGLEPSTTRSDLLSLIRVPRLGWPGYKSMSSSGLGFPMSWRNSKASLRPTPARVEAATRGPSQRPPATPLASESAVVTYSPRNFQPDFPAPPSVRSRARGSAPLGPAASPHRHTSPRCRHTSPRCRRTENVSAA